MDLHEIVDRELDAAGFSKAAFNPFTTKDHGRPAPGIDRSSDDVKALSEDIPDDSEIATKVDGSDKAKAVYRNPIAVVKQAVAGMPMKQILRKVAQDRAGRKLGLRKGNEVHRAFTRSEAVNRLKVAGMAQAIANLLPEEFLLPLVRQFKGSKVFPHAAEAEAFLLGKGLRAAAEVQDVEKARRLFEGAGGMPHIDPSQLALLQSQSQVLKDYVASPMSQTAWGAGLGGLAGAAGGAGLMHQLLRPGQQQQPAGPQISKVVPQ